MATRNSWRRPVAPPSPAATRSSTRPSSQKSAHLPPSISFSGVSDPSVNVVLAALLAKHVAVVTADGTKFSGFFGGTERPHAHHGLHLVVRYANPVHDDVSRPYIVVDRRGLVARKLLIPLNCVITVRAGALDFSNRNASRATDVSATRPSTFATDGDISRGTSGAGRTLQRFEHFAEEGTPAASPPVGASSKDELTFGDMANSSNIASVRNWDQFQVNETKFGVTTTFDEEEYTTKIDRSEAGYKERERIALRLAQEIETAPSDNPHVREERNQADAEKFDEEERYSGVQRGAPSARAELPRAVSAGATEGAKNSRANHSNERPRLSYAAAAAGANARSSKSPAPAQPVAASKSARSPPPSAPLSQQQPAVSLPQPPPQASVPVGQKTMPRPKQGGAPPGKSSPPAKPISSPPSQQGAKPAANGKSPVVSNGKITTGQKGTVQVKPANAEPALPGAPSTPAKPPAVKLAPVVPAKDVAEKNGKLPASRERAARDSHTIPRLMKVRNALTTGRTSPNQSRNSPLPTPAVADTSAVAVLNLDAQTPNLGPEQIKKFEEYKTNREIQSIAENRERITDDLKKFSTQLDSRNGPLRRGNNSSSGALNAVASSSTGPATSGAAAVTTSKSGAEDGKVDPAAKAEDAGASKPGKDQDVPSCGKEVGGDVNINPNKPEEGSGTMNSASKPADSSENKAKPRMKSKLNPNAAEFKFNPDAPSFKPATKKPPSPAPPLQPPYNSHAPVMGGPEFSQAVPNAPQPYPMPMQPMQPMPYGQPYTMMVPAAVAASMPGPGGAGMQFVQGAHVSYPVGQVPPGRFPQGVANPVPYGYPGMPPMVITGPVRRLYSGAPYQFYNPQQFAPPQPGTVPMSPPMQQPVYAQGQPAGPVHMGGGNVAPGGRGNPSGHSRRGGMGGRPRGRHHGQQGHQNGSHNQNIVGNSGERTAPRSPGGSVGGDVGQR